MKHNTKVILGALGIMLVAAVYVAACIIVGPGLFFVTLLVVAIIAVVLIIFAILCAWLDGIIPEDEEEPKGSETDY